jgi:hypothetical protein
MDPDREREIPRRQFVRSAVAIGGASALAACAEREQSLAETTAPGTVTAQTYPQGDQSVVPDGQHRWSGFLKRDAAGNTVPPQQQLVLGLDYEGSSPPTDDERQAVEDAFDTLTRAFQWGIGTNDGATFIRGLLFLIGYAPSYFEQVDAETDLMTAEELLERAGEDPEKTDDFDAVVVLTSDVGSVVLAAEEALYGNKDRVNGVEASGSITEAFSVAERRTGFAGRGIPADKLDNEEIPEQAPLTMGF